MHAFYNIHIRPWLIAGRSLAPRRSIVATRERQRTMNILGVKISVDRNPGPKLRWTRRVTAVAATGAVVLSGGVAYAIWTTTGSGSGTAKAGQAVALTTVTASAVSTGLLYPGGPSGDLRVTFDNPNPFAVKITSVSANGAVTAAGGAGTCTTTGVSLTNQTGLSLIIPAKSGTDGQLTTTLSGVVSMDNTSQDGCQTATFTVPISFAGTSN